MQLIHNLFSLSNKRCNQVKSIKHNPEPKTILEQISASQQNTQLNSLLSHAKFIGIKNNIFIFAVKDNFIRETLIRNYFFIIKRTLININNNIKMISIIVDDSTNNNILNTDSLNYTNSLSSDFNKKENLEESIFSRANPKFTLSNYITAESNIVAYKIIRDIALQNINYNHNNVFYIHSLVGMGKTHLLQSIINEIHNYDRNSKYKHNYSRKYRLRVGYLSAERFMHNFIRAIKNNNLFTLRDKIKEVDIFLIDDIHFICGKESTQKEFSYILNSLIESGKKIVIASTIPCHMLDLNDERTKSILRSSNTIHIESCDYELRLKILKNYNKNSDIIFEESILKILADKITTNIRELEAGLNNIKTYLNISGKKVTRDNICHYIQNYIKDSVKKVTIHCIINAVAKYYKVSSTDIISKKRTQKLVMARQIIAFLSKEITTDSFKIIGQKIGCRDHSTVLYYLKKIDVHMREKKHLISDINLIKNSLL